MFAVEYIFSPLCLEDSMLMFCTFVPYRKGLEEMFGSALVKDRAKLQAAVQLVRLPGTRHVLINKKS